MMITYHKNNNGKPAPVFVVLLFLLFLFSFLITGCVTHFKNPLTDPGKQALDPSVYGTWFEQKESESIFIHMGKDKKTGLLRVAMVEFDGKNEMEISEWSGHTSLFGKSRYLNLKQIPAEKNKTGGYMIIKYEISRDRFNFYLMDDAIVEKAVKEGKLNGKIIKETYSSFAWVTQSQDKLKQFILENDSDLFTDLTSFPRLAKP